MSFGNELKKDVYLDPVLCNALTVRFILCYFRFFFSYSSFVYLFILSAFVEFVVYSQRHVLSFAE